MNQSSALRVIVARQAVRSEQRRQELYNRAREISRNYFERDLNVEQCTECGPSRIVFTHEPFTVTVFYGGKDVYWNVTAPPCRECLAQWMIYSPTVEAFDDAVVNEYLRTRWHEESCSYAPR